MKKILFLLLILFLTNCAFGSEKEDEQFNCINSGRTNAINRALIEDGFQGKSLEDLNPVEKHKVLTDKKKYFDINQCYKN